MKKEVVVVQCSACDSQFVKEDMRWHRGDAIPHCPNCHEHDMIFFSHFGYVGVEVDEND